MNFAVKIKKLNYQALPIFGVTLAYGVGLVMIGYTYAQIGKLTGLSAAQQPLLAIPQSVGIYLGTLVLSWFMARYSVRKIFLVGMTLTLISTILLSQLDRLAGAGPANSIHTKALIAYLILNSTFGLGLSVTLPITNTYFTAAYPDKKESLKMVSINSGIFCIGAAILPLVAGQAIIAASKSNYFDAVRYFYYIAIGFIALGVISSLFVTYREDQNSMGVVEKQTEEALGMTVPINKKTNQKIKPKRLITEILIISSGFLILGILAETVFYYSFISFFDTANNSHRLIIATQAFGLFFLVQGLTRLTVGTIVSRRFTNRWILTISLILIAIASVFVATGLTKQHIYYTYIIAVIAGIGFGNLLPLLLNYSTRAYPPKSSLLSIWANSSSNMPVGPTQIIVWQLLLLKNNSLLSLGLLCVGCVVFTLALVWYLIIRLRIRDFEPNDAQGHHPPKVIDPLLGATNTDKNSANP